MKCNTDSPVFHFLGTMTDFVILNAVFLLTCIPVVTIGPAVCALFSITMREAREEHGYMVRPYLHALRQNFRSAFQLYIIYAVVGAILLFNIMFWRKMGTIVGNVVFLILAVCALVYLLSLCYGFALNARFTNTVRQTLKNSVLIALTEIRYSAALLFILILGIVLYCVWDIWRVFLMVFGFAFLFYCGAYILVKVFEKYEPESVINVVSDNNDRERTCEYGENGKFKKNND